MIDQKLAKRLLRIFEQKRIVTFMYFGTRAFDINVNKNSDYDFILVLDRFILTDSMKIRSILQQKPFLGLEINLSYIYLHDIKIRGFDNFQIRSVLKDLCIYLVGAKVLLGKNIFLENPIHVSGKKIQQIMSFKIQEFYGRCDKLFTQNLPNNKLCALLRHNIKTMTRYYLIMLGFVKIKDIDKVSYGRIFEIAKANKLFSYQFYNLSSKLLKYQSDKRAIQNLEFLRRIVYEKYLKTLTL